MRLLLIIVALITLPSCYTPQKERQVKQDIFNLQTRLIEIERGMEEKGRVSEDSLSKRIAGTSSQLDKIVADMARVRGDVDALRVGVVTGQMPGSDPEKEGSVALQIRNLTQRIEQIEQMQSELVAQLNKKSLAVKSGLVAKGGAIGSKDIKAAFDKSRFKYVAEQAPAVLKGAKGKDAEDVLYMYAESLFRTNKLREAALKFNELIDMKPDAKRLPYAKMRMGDCFRSLGDVATAKLYYQDVVEKHPESSEAGRARERLQASAEKPKGANASRLKKKSSVATKLQRTRDKKSARQ